MHIGIFFIFKAATEIKVLLYHITGYPSKDSRSRDGWNVSLKHLSDGTIEVVHSREEVAFDESFDFKWDLALDFVKANSSSLELQSVSLKTYHVNFRKEGISFEMRRKVSQAIKAINL